MTKARTKSAKIARKRGRPKATCVYREPNGRTSRAKDPPAKVALEARARMTGLSTTDAMDQSAETFIGRLHMAYARWEKAKNGPQPRMSLSTSQYWAALQYMEIANDHAKALQSPGAYYDPRLSAGGDEEAHERFSDAAKKRYDGARKAIQKAQDDNRGANLWAALDLCIMRNESHTHMIGDLRLLCTALNRHFKNE